MAADLCVVQDGQLHLNLHPGQARAWNSTKRFVAVLAGTQGGKTSFGPHWMVKEIQSRGPGDYGIVTPTFQLLEKKLLPEVKRVFTNWLGLGTYQGSPSRKFTVSPDGARFLFGHYSPDQPTVIWFGYAEDPDSLESATWRAVWCDEAGQRKFKLGSWEAIRRRLSLAQGRALITTTPYDLGWLKQKVYDVWKAAKDRGILDTCEFDVIRFDSTENPNFPQVEFEAARLTLPAWKFNLFYRGIFTRPAGMIYGSFIDDYLPRGHKIQPFPIPMEWNRYLGMDFGNVNTAASFWAEEKARTSIPGVWGQPTGRYICYRTYHTGGRTPEEHVQAILLNEPRLPYAVGGAPSEDEWRDKFRGAGLPIARPTITDVEVGISAVYAAHAQGKTLVFDSLEEYLEQKMTYSREVDVNGEPTDKIEDKATFHILDTERYILSQLCGNISSLTVLKKGKAY